jgi:hypothetical protein
MREIQAGNDLPSRLIQLPHPLQARPVVKRRPKEGVPRAHLFNRHTHWGDDFLRLRRKRLKLKPQHDRRQQHRRPPFFFIADYHKP